jgi:hypothetical protein
MVRENGHHDLLLGEEVASSMPHASRHPPTRVAARAAPQRTAERASVVQSQLAPNGPLVAARELLHNPLGVTTSTTSSTWHRFPQAQRGDLRLGSTIVRAVHPALCTLHQ